jgi:hypothetical protein
MSIVLKKAGSRGKDKCVPRLERSRGTVAFAATNTAMSLVVAGWLLATRESLVEETLDVIERFIKKDAHVGGVVIGESN